MTDSTHKKDNNVYHVLSWAEREAGVVVFSAQYLKDRMLRVRLQNWLDDVEEPQEDTNLWKCRVCKGNRR